MRRKQVLLSSFGLIFSFYTGTLFSISDTLFESVPPSKTNIYFKNTTVFSSELNILQYPYYYNGGGVAVGDLNNDGLVDVYFTSNVKGGNKLYLNKGNFVFQDITERAGVAGISDWCSGVTMADINSDGFLDIYVSVISNVFNLKGHNQLFINNGNGTFTDQSEAFGLDIYGATSQSAFFDYDHDGDLDCFILSQSLIPNDRFPNSKKRIYVDSIFKSRLFRNEISKGQNKFTDVSAFAGIYQSDIGYGLGISVADVNNDGWEDIYIGNDFYENDYYYVNNGNGTFTESGEKTFNHFTMNSMGNDIADYNNDGQLDIITTDMLSSDEKRLKKEAVDEEPYIYDFKYTDNGFYYQYVKNCLQTNNGDGASFSETSLISGVSATAWSWAPLFADFDNDGNKDLIITSGIEKNFIDMDFLKFAKEQVKKEYSPDQNALNLQAINSMSSGASHPFLFKGDGQLMFKDVSDNWGTKKLEGCTNGAAYADFDNDGDLDLVLNSFNDTALILKNNTHQKNFIVFTLKGNDLNKNAIGAKVYLFSNGKIQYRQIIMTRGFQSSVDPRIYFGLNDLTNIDSALIVWTSQKYVTLKNLTANNHYIIQQDNAGADFVYSNYFKQNEDKFEDITDKINCDWKHKENTANDFYAQFLIPQAKSKRGPKVAIADVNKDGLDDFYVCGAYKQPGALMIQNKEGHFLRSNVALFRIDSVAEDVDAVFFDADNDNDLDLYVVSGGNMFKNNDINLLDRLYLNNGKGEFKKSINASPLIYKDKSCITTSDIDNDGDIDLFVGGFVDAENYGIPQTSYLLINNGKGIFSIKENNFENMGIVTDAEFADVNNDNYNDLVVIGEWMPVTVFINKKGEFIKTVIPNSTGLWQSVFLDDVNSDGNMDIVLGNWGYNNKFWDNKNPPLRLYIGDFDKNGNIDHLLTYITNGVEYSFLGKEKIERSLPALKKKYLYFKNFSGVPFKDAFGAWVANVKPLEAERLGSALCYGDGKGSFKMEDLPKDLQLAPVCSIGKTLQTNEFLLGGNLFEAPPYEGRYDAQPFALFNFNKNSINRIHQRNFDIIKGQVRDIKWINTAYGKVLLVARNNEKLLFYKPKLKP